MLRLLLILALLAVATYLIIRVVQDRGVELPKSPKPKRPAPRRIVAPDDDEDFLRELDKKKRSGNPEDPTD